MFNLKGLLKRFPPKASLIGRGGGSATQEPRLGTGFVYEIGVKITRRVGGPIATGARVEKNQETVVQTYIGLTRFSVFKRLEEHRDLAIRLGELGDVYTRDRYGGERYRKELKKVKGAGPLHIALRMAMGTKQTQPNQYDNFIAKARPVLSTSLFSLPVAEHREITKRGTAGLQKGHLNNYYSSVIQNRTNSFNLDDDVRYGDVRWRDVVDLEKATATYIYLTEEADQKYVKQYVNALGPERREFQAERLFTAFYRVNPNFLNVGQNIFGPHAAKLKRHLKAMHAFKTVIHNLFDGKPEPFKRGFVRGAVISYFDMVKNPQRSHTKAMKEFFQSLDVASQDISLSEILDPSGKTGKTFSNLEHSVKEMEREIDEISVETSDGIFMSMTEFLYKEVIEKLNKK